jgi:hypothetical protein
MKITRLTRLLCLLTSFRRLMRAIVSHATACKNMGDAIRANHGLREYRRVRADYSATRHEAIKRLSFILRLQSLA